MENNQENEKITSLKKHKKISIAATIGGAIVATGAIVLGAVGVITVMPSIMVSLLGLLGVSVGARMTSFASHEIKEVRLDEARRIQRETYEIEKQQKKEAFYNRLKENKAERSEDTASDFKSFSQNQNISDDTQAL